MTRLPPLPVPALPDSAAADTLDAGPTDPPFPQQDDIFGQLLGEPGYQVVQYQGRGVELEVDRQRVQLNREAQVMYEQSTIDADTITYEAGLQFVRGCGNISLTGEGENVISDECLNYDVSATKGTVVDARTSFAQQGADWFIRGLMTMRGSGTAFVETGNFTSCDLDEPHYYFRAGQIKVVSDDIVVAWPVTLYIQNVPVAWLPFFAQDIREERRSGFLPPRFGFNDVVASSSNARRSITDFGYYFAFSDFMDAQATADWFSGRFTRLNGAVRYRSIKKFFRGNVIASYSFGNEKTLQFQMRHNHELTPVTDIRVNANFISNTTVFERQTFDPTVQTQRIASDVGVQHRFPFASVNLSGSRRQDLGAQKGRTDLTLPKLQMTFSPLTLFRAPEQPQRAVQQYRRQRRLLRFAPRPDPGRERRQENRSCVREQCRPHRLLRSQWADELQPEHGTSVPADARRRHHGVRGVRERVETGLRSAGGIPDRPHREHDAASHAERGREPVSVGRHERRVHHRADASPLRSRGVHRSLRVFARRRPVRADPPQGLAALSLRLFTGRGSLRFPAFDPRVPGVEFQGGEPASRHPEPDV